MATAVAFLFYERQRITFRRIEPIGLTHDESLADPWLLETHESFHSERRLLPGAVCTR